MKAVNKLSNAKSIFQMINKKNIWILALLLSFCKLHAQHVEVHFSNVSLEKVLVEISKKYKVQFSYSNNYLKLDKKISFHSKGKTLQATLEDLFGANNIVCAKIGSQLVLKPNKKKDKKRSERKRRKKKRREKREQKDQQTLKRGTLFEFDLHSELMGSTTTVVPVKEEKVERDFISTNEIQPVISEGIAGYIDHENVLKSQQATYVDPGKQKKAKVRALQFSILPFLGSNGRNFWASNVVSMNLFWGLNGGLHGFEMGGIGNSITGKVHGLQVGGMFNTAKKNLVGMQLAGLLNMTKGNVFGMQLGGIFNWGSDVYGSQIGGLGNVARQLYGMQLSGLSNMASDIYGFQIAGILNFANGKLFGSQIGGVGNIAWGGRSAVQFAGGFNMSAKAQFQIAGLFNVAQNIEGAQLGTANIAKKVIGMQFGVVNTTRSLVGGQIGVINIAKKATGIMIGLINVVDSVKGLPLGLINIVKKNGYNRLELLGSETMYINLGAKFGARYLYHIVQAGWRINQDNSYAWSVGLGLGTMLPINEQIHLNLELLTSHVNETDLWTSSLNLLNQFRVTMDLRISEKTSFFFGPSFNLQISNLYNKDTQEYGSAIVPYTLYNQTHNGTNLKMWIGGVLGLRF